MNRQQRLELKAAKRSYKLALKNKENYLNKRNTLVMAILDHSFPKWDSIKISLAKI
jgi:hypothetical protein